MSVIQGLLTDKMMDYLSGVIHGAQVKINGNWERHGIFKTVRDGNALTKYIYLDSGLGGVEEAQLLTNQSEVLATKTFEIEKGEDGLVLAFRFNLVVEEE